MTRPRGNRDVLLISFLCTGWLRERSFSDKTLNNITNFQLSYVFFPVFLFTLRKHEKPESLCGLCSRARAWLPSNLFLFFLLVVVRAHAVRLF